MSLLGKRKGRPITRIQFKLILNKFLVFLKRELKLSYDIPVILVDDVDFAKNIASFGEISSKNVIYLSIINRHPMDILRTLAHEYAHYKQNQEKKLSSKNKISVEYEANAKSGEIMRKFGLMHPEYFYFTSIK